MAVSVDELTLNELQKHELGASSLDERGNPQATVLRMFVASPHQHTGAISLELQDAVTNQTLCRVQTEDGSLQYGTGMQAGNERGYLVGTRSCTWDLSDAPRLPPSRLLRTIATYDARSHQYGVMSEWIIYGDAVPVALDAAERPAPLQRTGTAELT